MAAEEALAFRERFGTVRRVELVAGHPALEVEQEIPVLEGDPRDPLSTGCTIWEGERLAKLLAEDSELRSRVVDGRRVLELGSGTGVCGLAAAALGASQVVMTDLPDRLPLLRRNVRRNNWLSTMNSCVVDVAELAWGCPTFALLGALSTFDQASPDVVLAADVAYAPEHVAPLATTLAAVLLRCDSPDALALLACRKHHPLAYAAFLSAL